MREIKFEWYCEKCKKMYSNKDCFLVIDKDGILETDGCVCDNEHKKLRQYTGLKDKNGVEIYEGDIVEWKHPQGRNGNYEIIYFGYKFGTRFFNKGYLDTPTDIFCESMEFIKVIGNIYENKELLEAAK